LHRTSVKGEPAGTASLRHPTGATERPVRETKAPSRIIARTLVGYPQRLAAPWPFDLRLPAPVRCRRLRVGFQYGRASSGVAPFPARSILDALPAGRHGATSGATMARTPSRLSSLRARPFARFPGAGLARGPSARHRGELVMIPPRRGPLSGIPAARPAGRPGLAHRQSEGQAAG
jgi:hypothetical protein